MVSLGDKKPVKADDQNGKNATEPDCDCPDLFETWNHQPDLRGPECEDSMGEVHSSRLREPEVSVLFKVIWTRRFQSLKSRKGRKKVSDYLIQFIAPQAWARPFPR